VIKVVSFKVSDEIYDKMKNTGKTFKELLEPLITDYDHESICRWLDSIMVDD